MAPSKPKLSKTRLISAWQCPKKLHLEKNHPEFGDLSAQTESLFATGHRVGSIAKQIYGGGGGVEVAFNFRSMLAETQELLESESRFPIFEASFEYQGVLVRIDVLLPGAGGWHIVEVKASTSVKDYHLLDCAIQDWVLRNCGVSVCSIRLAHINNQFVYQGDEDFEGLLLEQDVTQRARILEPQVIALLATARSAVSGPQPQINVGSQCYSPYECQFVAHCWPTHTRYPITGLGGSKAKLGELVAEGYHDILDVDETSLHSETQQRILRVTCKGEAEVLPGAGKVLSELPWPRFYLDFETIAPAVPLWPNTRPYQALPVQWSCHIENIDGSVRHDEFLDLSGRAPMRALAEQLLNCLGQHGAVLMYTNYEAQVIDTLAEMYPDLAEHLTQLRGRLFDLHTLVKAHYYHPDMLGSWSLKAVAPCIAPHMNYATLQGINDGTAAADGYLEAIDPATDMLRKLELEQQLLRYCRFDTEAMVEITRFLAAH